MGYSQGDCSGAGQGRKRLLVNQVLSQPGDITADTMTAYNETLVTAPAEGGVIVISFNPTTGAVVKTFFLENGGPEEYLTFNWLTITAAGRVLIAESTFARSFTIGRDTVTGHNGNSPKTFLAELRSDLTPGNPR